MKKTLITSMLFLTSSLMADYELFTGYTKPLNSIKAVKSEVVFEGDYEDYVKELGKHRKIGTGWGAMIGAASAGAMGAGIGVFAVALSSLNDDQKFARVVKISDAKGNFTLKTVYMIGDKNPSYSLEEAKAIMQGAK